MYITLSHGTLQYGSGQTTVYALHDANLSLEEGKICVVLGPSGSGKSTLLNILGGLSALDQGQLVVGEKKVSDLKGKALTQYRKEDVGFVFQFYNLIGDLTVQENIQVVSDIAKNPLPLDDLLEALEIADLRYRFPKELSGGQAQRVAIARAMIKNPKLLLCDELTGALDTASSKRVLCAIEKMHLQYGTTVIMITHNEAISAMADVVVRLRDGAVVSCVENTNKLAAEALTL